jgi:uncharacterized membrane protein YccC
MRYSSEIKKFLYSQYFLGGLRIAIGISLPPILCLLVFQSHDLAFTISAGSLGACAIDMPGPLKYKHNEMLAGSLIGFFGALLTGLASPNLYALGLTIVPVSFALSLITVYGKRWPQISFAALFMMVMSLADPLTPLSALINASLMLLGGLWYTYWSTITTRLMASRIERQALAESVFACSDYLLARADFYDTAKELDDCWRDLVARQIEAVETQETARDIVLRNLPDLQQGRASARRTAIFNLFINIVDLHEMFVSAHTDYQLVREVFGKSDLMVFYRDLLRKIAAELEEIGFAVLERRTPVTRVSTKAELRAIEYEIELMRQGKLRETQGEAYASVLSTYRRVWSAARLIDRMRRNFTAELEGVKPEIRVDRALRRFLQPRRLSPKLILSNLNLRSPSFRHALRVTIAVTAAFWLGHLLPLTNAYWVVMTCIIILKPGYSQTKQRNTQRIVGTLIGCALVVALILTVKSPWVLAAVMFASMVLSYSFLLFNYATSVVFTSAYVLLMFHLLAPNSLAIIGERAVDTGLGCLIAIIASRLFPYWEYRAIGPLMQTLITASRRLLSAAAPVGRPAGAQKDPDADYAYRLARKEANMAFSNLGQAFRRMMIEPKAHQRFVPELNDLLVQAHVLGAEITAAAPLLRGIPADTPERNALSAALAAIDEQLAQALAGLPPPADQPDAQRRVNHMLDSMVVAAETARGAGADDTPDLKVLAHQCKQMLAAAVLVRKDAGAIRLPGTRYAQ